MDLSPFPKYKNLENLSKRIESFQDYLFYLHLYN